MNLPAAGVLEKFVEGGVSGVHLGPLNGVGHHLRRVHLPAPSLLQVSINSEEVHC